MMNPVAIIESIGKLAQASKVVQDIENYNPQHHATPEYQELIAECKAFVGDLDTLNQRAQKIMLLETDLVHRIKTDLDAQK